MSGFASIEYFCTNYVNEHWPADYGDVWAAVDAFLNEEPARARNLPAEVERLMSRGLGEEQLELLLTTDMGCGYSPRTGGSTYRAWLREVAQRATAATPQHGAGSPDHDEGGEG